jgi:hypothetical protein
MAKGLLDGVNHKRLLTGVLALFVYIWVTDFLIHGVLLSKLYAQTAHIWRPGMDKGEGLGFMFASQVLTSAMFMFIFAKGYQKLGLIEGVRYGFVIWLFTMGGTFMQYAVYPITREIFLAWTITSLVQCLLGGVLAALVYKK